MNPTLPTFLVWVDHLPAFASQDWQRMEEKAEAARAHGRLARVERIAPEWTRADWCGMLPPGHPSHAFGGTSTEFVCKGSP